jgi:hypothetical protein
MSNNIPTPSIVLATAVLRAIELHEGSYDTAAAEEASAEYNAVTNRLVLTPDYEQFYTRSLTDCCLQAANESGDSDLQLPIYFLASSRFNDCQEWAKQVLLHSPANRN